MDQAVSKDGVVAGGSELVRRIAAVWPAVAAPGSSPPLVVHAGDVAVAEARPHLAVLSAGAPLRFSTLGSGCAAVVVDGLPPPPARWPRRPHPRRDGVPPEPFRVLAPALWHDRLAPSLSDMSWPVVLVERADGEPCHGVILDGATPAALLQPARAGAILIDPDGPWTLADGGPLLWEGRGGASARLAALLRLLCREPLLRRRIGVAQRDAFLAASDEDALRRLLAAVAARDGAGQEAASPPIRRVVIEGSIGSVFSLAAVNRELGRALAAEGLSVELRSSEGEVGDFDETGAPAFADPALRGLCRPAGAPMPAPSGTAILRLMYPPRADDFDACDLPAFSLYAWEETEFPRDWAEAMNHHLCLVTTLSAHVARCLRAAGYRGPLLVGGCGADHLPVPTDADRAEAARLLAGLEGRFLFLHLSSALPRKGIDALLEAWAELAREPGFEAALVLKTQDFPHNDVAARMAALGLAGTGRAPVRELRGDLPAGVLAALIARADAIVQPSRAEGFGLPVVEGMLAGKPVVATAWSALSEIVTEETGWPVAVRLEPARTHLSGFLSAWAEPDRASLAARLREVRQAPAPEIAHRVAAGRALARRWFRWSDVARRTAWALERAGGAEALKAALRPVELAAVTTWNARCGIADYAEKQLAAVPRANLRILANEVEETLGEDEPFVRRCWRVDRAGSAEAVRPHLVGADAVCVQFTFGLHGFADLAAILDEARERGQAAIAVLHRTAPPPDRPEVSLASIARSLDRADAVLVHTVADMDRLHALGVRDPVMLFPHGAPEPVPGVEPPPRIAEFLRGREAVLAAFGYSLPHKGFGDLIEAFPAIRSALREQGAGRVGLLLLTARYPTVASDASLAECRRRIASLGLAEECLLVDEHLPEAEALAALSRAMAIIYPYRDSAESSSAAVRFGLATGRPVVTSECAIFSDLGEVCRRFPPLAGGAGRKELLGLLRDIREGAPAAARAAERQDAWRKAHAWPRLAERFHDIVRGVVFERRMGGPWASARRGSFWMPETVDGS